MSSFQINLHETLYSLSDALDLVGVVQIHHGKRVAFMAAEVGLQLGWPEERLDNLFMAAMLHDCGVANTAIHARLAQFEWEKEKEHCKIGALLLRETPPLAHLAETVLHHHTHWNELKEKSIPDEIKLLANCIYLVDRVDVLSLHSQVRNPNILLSSRDIRDKISDKSDDWFHPDLVDAFLKVSNSEAFWLSLEREHVDGYVSQWIDHDSTREIDFFDLKSIVKIFSHIVDAKSKFTREHSDGVANLSRYLGEKFDLPEHNCDMLELAGLLHDLGKLRVPDEVLEKPGKLSESEFATIQRHSFDTLNILKKIRGFESIAQWAGQHHERVDGSGYPYHSDQERLPLEARIIAVADVFQALAQERPYRSSMPKDKVLSILKEEVEQGKLDRTVVDAIEADLDRCWNVATLQDN
ncbi:MAG: HD domain-containing phosphohydrolase [Mariprofundaceae bacterium]